jgi:hypothetical protein
MAKGMLLHTIGRILTDSTERPLPVERPSPARR